MGWNAAYTALESNVIAAYDMGKLDEPLLRILMEPYRNSDIDHGGSKRVVSRDGKSCDEIIVEVLVPEDHKKLAGLSKQSIEYGDLLFDAWVKVTRREFEYW